MKRELKFDRAIYLVDDRARTYVFLRRNPDWKEIDDATNRKNKRSISGYTRLFRDGRKKTFIFMEEENNLPAA